MDESTARAMIEDHFAASGIGAAGGGPGYEIARASQIYADDAVHDRYGGRPTNVVGIMEFRDGKVVRERI